ncbi:MAG: type II toxin-antitoxin system prevent-host-death family antitoxin [Propionibacteriaceae bacterium]|nr:type II toxin-antitoxin system prevent-host-death family antitoxin [Propionibacteriaceae bacterium]
MSYVAISELENPVGLRALRANLSSYIETVKQGRTFTLTEHGRAVARLVPVSGASAYERLVMDGLIEASRRQPVPLEPPIVTQGTVSDLVAGQRR